MGLEKTGRIARIVIDPANPNIVMACALGHAYGPQQERGVFRSTDGGTTWTRTLFTDENAGCSELTMNPQNSQVLYAGMWTLEIHTWGRVSGGPGSGLFKSTDGGVTWTRLRGNGLPAQNIGKVEVAIAPSTPNRVYAMLETGNEDTEDGQLWRSENAGESSCRADDSCLPYSPAPRKIRSLRYRHGFSSRWGISHRHRQRGSREFSPSPTAVGSNHYSRVPASSPFDSTPST
jgi:hypothetical protein